LTEFVLDFVQNIEIDLMMQGSIEGVVEGVPQTVRGKTWRSVMLDSFSCWKFSFLDPIYKFPRASTLVCNFLNFAIKERPLSFFNSRLEGLSDVSTSRRPITVQC